MRDQPLIDISRTVSEATAVFPGDTRFSRQWVMSIATGCSCNTSAITLSSHCGTHADAPSHFVNGAKAIAEVDLSLYVGRCRVIQTRDPDSVRVSDVEGLDLKRAERILFRTPRPLRDDEWRDDFTYLSIDLARHLAQGGIRLVGIDTPSVDPMTSKPLLAHKLLLQGDVAILESLDLSRAPAGLYELIALPLKIAGGDSSPVRAALRPIA